MSMMEKAAYLRGLADGMKLADREQDESRLLLAMVNLMEEMAERVDANLDSINTLADELDELDDVVSSLEEGMEGMDSEEEEEAEYQLDCPECGGPVVLGEEALEVGETTCPHCGAHLSIDIGYEDTPE